MSNFASKQVQSGQDIVVAVDTSRPTSTATLDATTLCLIMASGSKKDDESGINQYYHNKTTVLQEARVFNESPISPRRCRALLAQIVYLLYVGELFGTQEATTLFFGVTKLFQHKDVSFACMLPRL